MKSQFTIIPVLLVLLTYGCGGNGKPEAGESSSESDTVQPRQEPKESNDKAGKRPVLNSETKWQANSETTLGIQKMLLLVTAQLTSEVTDLTELGDNLDQEFSQILKQCTMTGEAHDQLHNYLMPLKTKIDQLKKEPNTDNAVDIQNYLGNYTDYFK